MVVIYADAIIDELEIKIFYKYLNKLEFKKQIQDHLFEIIKDSVKNNKEFKEFLSKNFGDG
jgi:hypothetical protein